MSRFHYYWTRQQDDKLVDMKDNQKMSFREISLYFGRASNNCAERYHEVKMMRDQENSRLPEGTEVALRIDGKISRRKADRGHIVGPHQNSVLSPTGEERYLVQLQSEDGTAERRWVETSNMKVLNMACSKG
jgi:hypothetical protein